MMESQSGSEVLKTSRTDNVVNVFLSGFEGWQPQDPGRAGNSSPKAGKRQWPSSKTGQRNTLLFG